MLLDQIAPRVDPDLLPSFGVARKPERESASRYYLLRAAPLDIEPKATGLLVTLGTPEGDLLEATLPRLDLRLRGELCWAVLAVHEGPGSYPLHRHVLGLWPCDPLFTLDVA